MATPVQDKYFLKSLHEEIALFDRKLAHLLKYETFPTDAARKTSASKMEAKRNLLVEKARRLASEGIEFKPSELPQSLRTDQAGSEAVAPRKPATDTVASLDETPAEVRAGAHTHVSHSPFAGTVLDGQAYVIEAYKRSRAKLSS